MTCANSKVWGTVLMKDFNEVDFFFFSLLLAIYWVESNTFFFFRQKQIERFLINFVSPDVLAYNYQKKLQEWTSPESNRRPFACKANAITPTLHAQLTYKYNYQYKFVQSYNQKGF